MKIDGKKVCAFRKAKGLSQEKLAELSKVNLRTIQRIENNISTPHGNTINSICKVLGIKINDISIKEDQNKSEFIFGYKVASKGKRFVANLLESFIYITVVGVPFLLYAKLTKNYSSNLSNAIGVGHLTAFSLFVGAIFYPLFKGNLGHKIFGLKVISAENGEDYDKATEGAIREFLKYFLGYLLIPLLWILLDDKNQNSYDKLTKTIVVENNDSL